MSEKKKIKCPKDCGQKSNGVKPTNEQLEQRVEYVSDLLVKLKKRMEIHRAVKKKWKVHWRTVDRYTVLASKYLQKRSRMDKEEARSIGVNALLRVIAEGKSNEIVQAEKRWADIWGYNAPTIIRDNIRPEKQIIINNPQQAASVVLYLPEGRSSTFKEPEPMKEKPPLPEVKP